MQNFKNFNCTKYFFEKKFLQQKKIDRRVNLWLNLKMISAHLTTILLMINVLRKNVLKISP